MSFGTRLRNARKKKGLTQLEVARRIGIDFTTISKYENNHSEPDNETLQKLAILYGVSADYLLDFPGWEQSSTDLSEDIVLIPVLGVVRAGFGLYADQQIIDYQPVKKSLVQDGKYFFLRVQGDSMIGDQIYDGDLVLIRHQNWVENGKIGVVIVNSEEGTLKRIFYGDNGTILLHSSNSSYQPKSYPAKNVEIVGLALQFMRTLK